MEEYEEARKAFAMAQALEPSNGVYTIWVAKCDQQLKGISDGSGLFSPQGKRDNHRIHAVGFDSAHLIGLLPRAPLK